MLRKKMSVRKISLKDVQNFYHSDDMCQESLWVDITVALINKKSYLV